MSEYGFNMFVNPLHVDEEVFLDEGHISLVCDVNNHANKMNGSDFSCFLMVLSFSLLH